MKTHILRANGDSHFTVCGIDTRKRDVLTERVTVSLKHITCKRCNGQAISR